MKNRPKSTETIDICIRFSDQVTSIVAITWMEIMIRIIVWGSIEDDWNLLCGFTTYPLTHETLWIRRETKLTIYLMEG